MFSAIFSYIFSSQAAKTAGAAAGGSVVSISVLMGVLDAKMTNQIEHINREMVSYVDKKHDLIGAEISLIRSELTFVRTSQAEQTATLRVISDRIYDINKRSRQ
jgi:hypothetical protein